MTTATSSPPTSPPLSPTSSSSSASSSALSSSSSPEVRTIEHLKRKERRKSLRERLVSSWGLHATAVDNGALDPSKPRHSVGLHKVQTGRVAGLAHLYEDNAAGVTDNLADERHHHNNNAPRRFDGSSSAGSPRVGLRYKNGTSEMYRSSPALGSPPVSARREVDAFRSEGNLSPYVRAAIHSASTPAEASDDSSVAAESPKSGKWRATKKAFGKTLWPKANKKASTADSAAAKDDGDGGEEAEKEEKKKAKSKAKAKKIQRKNKASADGDDAEDDDGEISSRGETAGGEVSLHVLIKMEDVEGIKKKLNNKKPKRGETSGGDDVVNLKNAVGSTPLHTAVEVGNLQVVQLLLQSGANPDVVDGIGWTPLLAACKAGNLPMANALLVDGKADANSKTNDLNTPLHYLSGKAPKEETRELYYEVMTKLLGKEGKVYGMVANNTTARNKNGDTPLHYAALQGKPEAVQWLLEHHAAVNNQNTYGDTALHCATIRGDVEMVQLLLKNGASKSLAGRSGTPKEIVKSEHADNAALQALF